jgi:hypothetical protein
MFIGVRRVRTRRAYVHRAAQLSQEINAIAEKMKTAPGLTVQAQAIREIQTMMVELTYIAKILKNQEVTQWVSNLALDIERTRGVVDGLQAAAAIDTRISQANASAPQVNDQTFLNNVLSCAKLNQVTGIKTVVVTDFCSAARVADILKIHTTTGQPFREALVRMNVGDWRFIDGATKLNADNILGYAGFFRRESDRGAGALFFLFLAPADRLQFVKESIDDVRTRYSAVMKEHGALEIPLVGVHNN